MTYLCSGHKERHREFGLDRRKLKKKCVGGTGGYFFLNSRNFTSSSGSKLWLKPLAAALHSLPYRQSSHCLLEDAALFNNDNTEWAPHTTCVPLTPTILKKKEKKTSLPRGTEIEPPLFRSITAHQKKREAEKRNKLRIEE